MGRYLEIAKDAYQLYIKSQVQNWLADLRAEWEERAAIIQFDGGLSKAEAERMAFEHFHI